MPASLPLYGQELAGGIRGAVYDADFEGPVPEVVVRLSELDLQTRTSEDGLFLFEAIRPGAYTLIFTKPDYERRVASSVVVVPGELAEVEVRLQAEYVEMEEFVARDLALDDTRSEIGLLSMRESSLSFQDSISSELMKQAGASDAAGALKLVVGASIVDGKFATVRGLSDRYVGTAVNGLRVPSSDPRKRAVHMDIFPAGTIESISVSKTFTPELPADWTGGGVTIRTVAIPDEPYLTLSFSREHDTSATRRDNFVTYDGGGVGDWGRHNGSRGMPEDAPDMEDLGLTDRGLTSNHVVLESPENPHDPEYLTYDRITRSFSPTMGTTMGEAYPNFGLDVSGGGKIDLGAGFAVGGNMAFTYSRKQDIMVLREKEYIVPPDSNPDDELDEDYTRTTGEEELKWSLITSLGVQKGEDHSITFHGIRNRAATDEASLRIQDNDPASEELWAQQQGIQYSERTIDIIQLIGDHNWPDAFGDIMGLEFDWYGAHNIAEQEEPDVRGFRNVVVPRGEGLYEYQPRPDNASGADEDASTRIWRNTKEDNSLYGFNFGLPFDMPAFDLNTSMKNNRSEWTTEQARLRFGSSWDFTKRTFRQNSFFYTFANQASPTTSQFGAPLRSDFPPGRTGLFQYLTAIQAWQNGPQGAAWQQAVSDSQESAKLATWITDDPDALWTDVFTDPERLGVGDYQDSMYWYVLPKFRDIDYDGDQKLRGGYWSFEFPVTKQLTFLYGARAELTDISIIPASDLDEIEPDRAYIVPSPNFITNANGEVSVTWTIEPVSKEEATADIDESYWLRSAGAVYELAPNMNLRGSWSQTIARPTFLELAPVVTFDFIENETFVGNNDLEISRVENLDARWEWFRKPGEVFAVSYFYKDITDPIEKISFGYLSQDYFLALNYPEGEIRGWEFEARKQLDFMPFPFNYFSVGANYTVIDAKVRIPDVLRNSLEFHGLEQNKRDMEGQPESLLNLNLTFNQENWGTTAGVFYNVQGDTLKAGAAVGESGATPNIYLEAREILNLTFSQRIGPNVKLSLKATNVTDPTIREVYREPDGTEKNRRKGKEGIRYAFSLSYTF